MEMKSDIISLGIESNEATWVKREIEKQLARKNYDCGKME